jgi:hypothetical protein
MSFKDDAEFRSRVERIPVQSIKMAFTGAYLFCGRVGEVICLKHPGDSTQGATGSQLTVERDTYIPNIQNPLEFQTLSLSIMTQTLKPVDLTQIMKIKEPVAIFTVATEKRLGWKREVALPLNPKYEPWTRPLMEYIQERKKDKLNIFPFYRQEMHKYAKIIFRGLDYKIQPYKRAVMENGQYQYEVKNDGGKKLLQTTVTDHRRDFGNHAIRHLRDAVLRNFYGFSGEDRALYGGWTLRTTTGAGSASQERYGEGGWRIYFPKLLKNSLYYKPKQDTGVPINEQSI